MAFKPHIVLQLKEAAFARHLESLEKNTVKEHFSAQLPEIKQINNKAPQELDVANSALVQLYDLLTQLIQKSHVLKNNSRNKSAVTIAVYLKDLKDLTINIHNYLLSLKSQPELWSYLLNKQGRLVVYYLIYLNLIHKDLVKSDSYTHELLNALEEQGCSKGSEQLMLQFLHFRLDSIADQQEHSLNSVDARVNNPFINAYWLLQSLEELPHMEDKLDVALSLNDRPLSLNSAIPNFILQFIQLQYATLFVIGMGDKETALQQMSSAKKLSEIGYLPANIQQIDGVSSLHCVKHITNLVYSVYRVMYSFALYNDPDLIVRQWHTNLMFFQVFLYYQMMHALPETEIRIIKATITQDDLLAHLTTALNLIRLIKQAPKSADPQLQDRMDLFWNAEKSIFCPEVLVQPDYVHVLSQNIHLISTEFANQGRLAEVCDILAGVLEFQDLFRNFKPNVYTFYSNLLVALRFIRDLPHPLDEKPNVLINTLFAQIEAKKYAYRLTHNELEQIYPELQNQVRFLFLSKLLFFVAHVNKASASTPGVSNQCYLLLQQVAETLAVPKKEFDAIYPYCSPTDDWSDDEAETEQKPEFVKKKVTKKAQAASSAASSSPRFFKLSDVDAAYVPRDALPQAIWDFADFIYKHTKIELILGGGAAAFLYLKKSNPRDYDFILLNISKEDLLKLLTQHGYKAQQVGIKVSIIKLQLETASGMLHLDLNTGMSKSAEPLTKTMEHILIKRDFKVSALYVVMQYGAQQLEVKGFDRAIRSLNSKLISVVNHKHALFVEEPNRLLRLLKICLQYSDFRVDDELQGILSTTDIKNCFVTYLQNPAFALMNRGQISTALEILFERFEIGAVLKKMDELGIFSALTDLCYEDIDDSLHLLEPYNAQDAYSKKRAVNLFLHMHYTVIHADIQKLNTWVFYGVARCVKPADQVAFNRVESAVLNIKSKVALPEGELKDWLTYIQALHQRTPAAAASSALYSH
ncbi:MAG: hypothetical protein P4L65_02065 [Legionella sp.]|nr:hypothetical protein [Legionella sp.]